MCITHVREGKTRLDIIKRWRRKERKVVNLIKFICCRVRGEGLLHLPAQVLSNIGKKHFPPDEAIEVTSVKNMLCGGREEGVCSIRLTAPTYHI